jgi:hypothetical protein
MTSSKPRFASRHTLERPIDPDQVQRLIDPESNWRLQNPVAADLIARLLEAGFRVNQVRPVPDGTWIGLGIKVNIIVYTRKGTVVVQGGVFENGSTGAALKKVLPATARWQR